mmetsp:Transcript_30145/g.96185  ORF Transcript_30145/g.96185 Transcript_30145/m.96185 type:complete len:592 (-) Transcript_30145:333-2108(-)
MRRKGSRQERRSLVDAEYSAELPEAAAQQSGGDGEQRSAPVALGERIRGSSGSLNRDGRGAYAPPPQAEGAMQSTSESFSAPIMDNDELARVESSEELMLTPGGSRRGRGSGRDSRSRSRNNNDEAEQMIGLPLVATDPPLAPMQRTDSRPAAPGSDLSEILRAVRHVSSSDSTGGPMRHPLAGDPNGIHNRRQVQAMALSAQIVLQELSWDPKDHKVLSRLKYVSMRDLYHYIDMIVHMSLSGVTDANALSAAQDNSGFLGKGGRGGKRGRADSATNNWASFAWLHPRDLRKLSVNYSVSNTASIIVRKHVILMNFDPLRAIVLHDRLLLLVPDGADSILLKTESRLTEFCKPVSQEVASALDHDENSPFELNAVEAVLSTVTEILNSEYQSIEPIVASTLQALQANNLRFAQDRLKFVKINIDAETTRVENMKMALERVLDDDFDMAMMRLSKMRDEPELYNSVPLSPEVISDHDNVEILLEAYLENLATLQTKLKFLHQQIQNTEESVTLKLDLSRNRLLTIDTIIAVVSCGFGLGGMVAGTFGMNLKNNNESSNEAFNHVIIWTALVIAFGVGMMCTYLVRTGMLLS